MALFWRPPQHSEFMSNYITQGLRKQRGMEFMNALQRQQELMRLNAMKQDPMIQRMWSDYKKATKSIEDPFRMDFDQFLLSIQNYKGGQGTRRSARHEDV